jgi:hypothetical protein
MNEYCKNVRKTQMRWSYIKKEGKQAIGEYKQTNVRVLATHLTTYSCTALYYAQDYKVHCGVALHPLDANCFKRNGPTYSAS